MSKFQPTPEQMRAINDRNKDILVSASAGSGKTAVLVDRVINMLKELPQQIIFATNDLDMVLDLCDEIILLNNGKIVSSGNPCEILANQELLEANGLELPQRYQR